MSLDTPLFMTNPDWYTYEEGAESEYGTNYVLTEEGRKNPDVVESWEEFVKNDSMMPDIDESEKDEAMKLFGLDED